jgi:hypothetical protein
MSMLRCAPCAGPRLVADILLTAALLLQVPHGRDLWQPQPVSGGYGGSLRMFGAAMPWGGGGPPPGAAPQVSSMLWWCGGLNERHPTVPLLCCLSLQHLRSGGDPPRPDAYQRHAPPHRRHNKILRMLAQLSVFAVASSHIFIGIAGSRPCDLVCSESPEGTESGTPALLPLAVQDTLLCVLQCAAPMPLPPTAFARSAQPMRSCAAAPKRSSGFLGGEPSLPGCF